MLAGWVIDIERRSARVGGPFGGGWRWVLGVKYAPRSIVLELLLFSVRITRQPW